MRANGRCWIRAGDDEPRSRGWPPDGIVGFSIAVVVAGNGEVAGKAPLLRCRRGGLLLGITYHVPVVGRQTA